MTEKFISLRVRVTQAIEGRRDAGQGTLEYVGMIIIAALVIVAVAAVVSPATIGARVTTAVNSVLNLA